MNSDKRLTHAELLLYRFLVAIPLDRYPLTDDQINANAALVHEAIDFLDGKTRYRDSVGGMRCDDV